MNPVTPVELFKATPRNNCKECGFLTCLAFATQVIVEKKPIEKCPYIDPDLRNSLKERIDEQHQVGKYVKKDLYKNTSEFIKEQLEDCDFSSVAEGIGAVFEEKEGIPLLRFSYMNRNCLLSKEEIFINGKAADNHWDNILLYNYVHFAGDAPLADEWIPIENIPGYTPKKSGLEQGCEEKIANHFQGRPARLQQAASTLGGKIAADASHADAAFTIFLLPKIPFYMLFWDEDPEEGFPARTKVLFDRSVINYLDLESLVFLAERFAETMIKVDQEPS